MEASYRFLWITPIKKSEHLLFNLLSFHYFKNSEDRNVLFFGSLGRLAPLTVVPYVAAMELTHLRGKGYFVKFKNRIVGIFVFREKNDALYISSLAVAPKYRRLGIGTHILKYAEKVAKRMQKKWLELSVSKVNTSALQLYKKNGFSIKKEKKWSFILRKKVETY